MKHLKIIGMCLAAVLALSALAATGASAEELPEVWQCGAAKKVSNKYTGHYVGKKCGASEKATKVQEEEGKLNKYEFEPWNLGSKTEKTGKEGKLKAFKGKSTPSFLEVHEVGPIKCPKGTDTGDFTGPKTVGNVEVTFTGCELNQHVCSNTGISGEIKTKTLAGEIGYYDEEEGKIVPREVGIDLKPQTGEFLGENIQCQSLNIRVRGSVIGEVVPPYNHFTKEVKLKFDQSNGVQAIQSFEGLPKDTLLTETCGVECFPAGENGLSAQSGEATNKGEELELRTT